MGRHLYVDANGNVYYQYSNGNRVPLIGEHPDELIPHIQAMYQRDGGALGSVEYSSGFSKQPKNSLARARARERITYFNKKWNDLSKGATPGNSSSGGKSGSGGKIKTNPPSGGATPEGPYSSGGLTKEDIIEKVENKVKYDPEVIDMGIQSAKILWQIGQKVWNWWKNRKQKPSEKELDKKIDQEIEKEKDPEKKPGGGKTEQPPKEPKPQPKPKPENKHKPGGKKEDPTSGSIGTYLPTHSRTYGYHNVSVAELYKLKTPSAQETWFPQSSDSEAALAAQLAGKPYYWKPPPARDILKRSTPGSTPGGTPETTTGETPSAYGNARFLLTNQ